MNDAINRQAAKDLHCAICKETNICYRSQASCEEVKLFDNLPPVPPVYFPSCEDCNKKMDEIRRAYDKLMEQEKNTTETE